jgi:IS30 family transposase
MPVECRRRFWNEVRAGLAPVEAARAVGVGPDTARGWFCEVGGVNPYGAEPLSGRYLSFSEREEIAVGVAEGLTQAEIARRLGRSPATISRELGRNSSSPKSSDSRAAPAYRAGRAQAQADRRALRPKPSKVMADPRLLAAVRSGLAERWSPEQISQRMRIDHPDDEAMRVSHETIYRTLYVHGRGELKRELVRTLRTGRTLRKPHRSTTERRGRIPDMVGIAERPAEAADRAVPGHWEGDLISGKNNSSQIGTLVERTTRMTLLLHLPEGRRAEQVRQAMAAKIAELPGHLARTITWDQGIEMSQHARFTLDTGIEVYFCDPHSPWQRGTNENTNGLLRQYFPKGTDLSGVTAEDLDSVAAELNGRPRKTLGWHTPAEALNALLSEPDATDGVIATTP